MNKQNAIRHILSKCYKATKSGAIDYEVCCQIAILLSDNNLWGIWLDRCDNCHFDDFGMCEIDDDDMAAPFCIASVAKLLEEELVKSKFEKSNLDYNKVTNQKEN